MDKEAGEDEKKSAALSSVLAACFLTTLKVIVGVMTGSLGILAEAAHSGLDFVAAIVTYIAVRASGKPADRDHPYGHGKIENFSALVETMLLLLTCAWIMREAVHRLAAKSVNVDASIWGFAILVISIAVDVTRSRMLYRVAAKHQSQALEADALHFSTDIWSSAVVVVGLLGVKVASWYPGLAFLQKADAVAALLVAAIVIGISFKLGMASIHALMDGTPEGATEKIQAAVEAIEGVCDCHAIRVRRAGPRYFVDMHVSMEGGQTLEWAHGIADKVESAVQETFPEADVTVHAEPKHCVENP
ncbi:MAG: cation diffusion facilitator family transporter [Chthoniobacteraceae bacterium]